MGRSSNRALDSALGLRVRTFLLAAITIAALFAGVAVIHSMASLTADASPATAASATHSGHNGHNGHNVISGASAGIATPNQSIAATVDPLCGDGCELEYLLVGMVCAISILVALLGVLLFRRPALPVERASELVRVLRMSASRIAPSPTPTLTFLSISRT